MAFRNIDRFLLPQAPPDQVSLDRDGNPIFVVPLSTDDLAGFNSKDPQQIAQMNNLVLSRGLVDPIALRQSQTKYLERFNITPNDSRYQEEMDRLAENSSRFMLGEARRIAEREQTYQELNGNLRQNVVYLAEDDENTCEECPTLNGEEGPYIQMRFDNMLPGDRCEGGNNCRCIIVAVN
jgi:hypothetical protein